MRLPILLLPLLATLGCDGAAGPGPGLGLVIDNPDPVDPSRPHFFDMGVLRHGTRAELPVVLVNHDPVTVTVEHVTPACACTRAKRIRLVDEAGQVLEEGDLERAGAALRVPPGGRVQLLVGINTNSVLPNREKLAIMRVSTDSVNTPFLTLEIHLACERPFLVTPASINLRDVPQGYGGSGSCQIMTGRPGGQDRVVDVAEATGGLETDLSHVFVNGEHVWTLTATLPPLRPMGAVQERVVLRTLDGRSEPGLLEVDVWAQVVDDVGFTPPSPHFGVLGQGEGGTLSLTLVARVPGMRVRLRDVRLAGPAARHLSATCQPEPGAYVDDDGRCQRWEVRIAAAGALPPGAFEAELIALLDDDQVPEVRTTLRGMVR